MSHIEATAGPISAGVRVRCLSRPRLGVGLVLALVGGCARVAFEGRLPELLPVADLERADAREGVTPHV